ncbi:MAG: hypothetical protein GXY94_03015 [Bacteroidales bacterium]|nr:hypothetical protein [Bacteroidales bacterium]
MQRIENRRSQTRASGGGDDGFTTGFGSNKVGTMSNPIILEGATVTAASPVSVTPADFAFSFANDATRVVQPFIPDMTELERLQTSIEYEQHVSMLSRMLSTLARWDRNLSGSGSYTNWNGDGLFQFYNPAGGGFGAGIHVNGRPRLLDVRTLPFQMGVSGGVGRGRIGYIGRNNSSSVAKDLLGAADMGAKSFQIGHESILMDIAIEAVKGNTGTANKPVVKTVTDASLESRVESTSAQLMSNKEAPVQEERIDTSLVFFLRVLKSDSTVIALPDKEGNYPPIDTIKYFDIIENGEVVKTISKFND